jgi:hypothetical protein
MKKNYILFFLLGLILSACEDSGSIPLGGAPIDLEGSWLLFEEGFSPGDHYIVRQVDPNPSQLVTFQSNGRVTSSLVNWQDVKSFKWSEDGGYKVVTLYTATPDEADPSDKGSAYTVKYDDDGNLILLFRFCIEGCHLKFRKVDSAEN